MEKGCSSLWRFSMNDRAYGKYQKTKKTLILSSHIWCDAPILSLITSKLSKFTHVI